MYCMRWSAPAPPVYAPSRARTLRRHAHPDDDEDDYGDEDENEDDYGEGDGDGYDDCDDESFLG